MRTIRKLSALLLALLLLSAHAYAAGDDVFIRVDRDDPDAWRRPLANVRFLPEEGMSGSAQFSVIQFGELAAALQERAEDIWIVDCRLESHGFINGIAVSWCGPDNAANLGLTAEEVEAEEAALAGIAGTSVTVWTAENDRPKAGTDLKAETWETERALTEEAGFHYLRLACPDHCWPPADVIDAFISFAKDLPGSAWLHFHCQAGSGRTGAFMTILEMMRRPDASAEEILRHQAETGSGNLLDRSAPEKSHAQKERCVLVRAMYRYIRDHQGSGFPVSWSEWLAAHSRTVTLRVGETLPGGGFSSDPLVVSDEMAALSPGQATVLAGDIVYFLTVAP